MSVLEGIRVGQIIEVTIGESLFIRNFVVIILKLASSKQICVDFLTYVLVIPLILHKKAIVTN